MKICYFIKVKCLFAIVFLSTTKAKEVFSPLDFTTFGAAGDVHRYTPPASLNRHQDPGLRFPFFSDVTSSAKDAAGVAPIRPRIDGPVQPALLVPILSPLSMIEWGDHRFLKNNGISGLVDDATRAHSGSLPGFLKHHPQSKMSVDEDEIESSPPIPVAAPLVQKPKNSIRSSERKYRSANSANEEYKLLRRLRRATEPSYKINRPMGRYFLFKKASNVRNTRTSGDQSDYYLRFLPSASGRFAGY